MAMVAAPDGFPTVAWSTPALVADAVTASKTAVPAIKETIRVRITTPPSSVGVAQV
jgi:hypothetical protein